MYISEFKVQMLVLISGLVIVATEFLARKVAAVKYQWFFATLVTLIISFGFSISDGTRFWCDSTQHGWFSQGHAIWHWVAALAMFTIFKHYTQATLKPQE